MKEDFNHINDDVLVKYLLGETDTEETSEVQAWIDADPAHRRQFEAYKLIWEESMRLKPQLKTDEDQAWQRFQDRIHGREVKPVPATAKFNFLWAAAVLILIAGAATWAFLHIENNSIADITKQSGDQVLIDTLSDGTRVTLNRHSGLTYPSKFAGDTRKVTLTGEAFFDVAPDKDHPFIVHINNIDIKVVGTSFNVRNMQGNTEVIVETGIVEVKGISGQVRLRPKEKVTVTKKDAAMSKEVVTEKLYNYYVSKEFVCDRTPLWKLVEILNEAYDTNIVIGRRELKELPLTTTFDNESLDNILNIISETFNIKVKREPGKIVLE